MKGKLQNFYFDIKNEIKIALSQKNILEVME